jgi:uncharacterized membrane protein YgcG
MKLLRSLRNTFLATALLAVPALAHAGVFVSVAVAPPAIPVYVQPLCPGDGYIWTPGYWAYGDDGYYWIDGAWVLAPYEGALWTPGYWGWGGGFYAWHTGYWGRHVGYYGGINYGFGYFGSGFYGGYWDRGRFFYNGAYNHVNVGNMHNIYQQRVNTAGFSRQGFENRGFSGNHAIASPGFNRAESGSFNRGASVQSSRSFAQPQSGFSRGGYAGGQSNARSSSPQSFSRPSGGGGFSSGGHSSGGGRR